MASGINPPDSVISRAETLPIMPDGTTVRTVAGMKLLRIALPNPARKTKSSITGNNPIKGNAIAKIDDTRPQRELSRPNTSRYWQLFESSFILLAIVKRRISAGKASITKIGLLGLGKMGFPLALNLRDHHFDVVAYDPAPAIRKKAAREAGLTLVKAEGELVRRLETPRRLWLMVPAGAPTDAALDALLPGLTPGDVVIDGGNSHYKDSVRRHARLAELGIHFLDCGTSGGTGGARSGACTMIGGERDVYELCRPVFDAVSLPGGSLYVGGPGAGHFVKMVHNGIEYGMMQAIAEGFEVLAKSGYELKLGEIAGLWQQGSVVRSWLMELAAEAFAKDPRLENLKGRMHSSGEGKWAVETALELGVPTPVIALSLMMRLRSLEDDTFAGRVVAALRREFGGHAVVKK